MSSQAPAPKRRRLRASCDLCRKKKVRCDSLEMPGNKCSNCINFKTQCTHLYISKDSSSSLNYKNSREHVAAILSQTKAYVPSNDPAVLYQILVDVAKYARNLETELLTISSTAVDLLPELGTFTPSDENISENILTPEKPDVSDDGLFVDGSITDPMRRLTLGLSISGENVNSRYFGKSSSMTFMKAAMEYANTPSGVTFEAQRPDFWVIPPFVPEPVPPQIFPDNDLLQTLLDLYFRQINPITFLLHSPSFRASVADGEHLRDPHFGFVVLTVCAVASRFSDDSRVLPTPDSPLHLAGWKWFEQVRTLEVVTSPYFPWLLKLQLICLSVLFLAGTATPPECWLLAGLGMRMAQQMGAHRRSRYSVASKIEAELLRRVFWFLVSMDTILSSAFGRPAATTSEDYDVDFPTEVDDEYWDVPHSFQQPANKTALATYVTSYLKLMEIFNRAQRTIYPVKVGKECGPEAVVELDSALNIWVDSIPSHLRWDSNREGIFLDQSASLYITYYYVQILIHRPFIPIPGKTPVTHSHFPSLAICANSARSCGHIMEVQSRRGGGAVLQPFVITALFDSAVILLLNVWGAQRAALAPADISRAVADIKKCVDVLHLYEKRWPVAGRHCDTITEMLNRAISRPVSLRPSLKRPMPEDPLAVDPPASTTVKQLEQLEMSLRQTEHFFSLPLSTQELGLLPVYESFDFHQDVAQHGPSSSLTNGSTSGHEYLQLNDADQLGLVPPSVDPQETTAAFSWQDWSNFADQEYKWEA